MFCSNHMFKDAWVSNTCKLKHFSYFKDICKKSMAGIAKKLLMLYTCSQPVREREKKLLVLV